MHLFHIDYKSGVPLYEQIVRSVITMAAAGAFPPNSPLPSVRSVAQQLGINPNTVQKAYALLERDGFIHSLPGKGSFLSDNSGAVEQKQEDARKILAKATKEAKESGLAPTEILALVNSVLKGDEETRD